jgi:KTSC domain
MPKIDNTTLRRLLQRKKEIPTGVESRCVASLDYEPFVEGGTTGDMTVTFVGPPNGGYGTYKYKDVPLNVYVDFAGAASQGQYFNLYIKNQFAYERIS